MTRAERAEVQRAQDSRPPLALLELHLVQRVARGEPFLTHRLARGSLAQIPPALLLLCPQCWGLKNEPPDGAGEEQVVLADSNVHLPLLQRAKRSKESMWGRASHFPLPPRPVTSPPSCRHSELQPIVENNTTMQQLQMAPFTSHCTKLKAWLPSLSIISLI